MSFYKKQTEKIELVSRPEDLQEKAEQQTSDPTAGKKVGAIPGGSIGETVKSLKFGRCDHS